jgi:CRISPR-associated endonuclease/helicase Cas3
MTECLDKKGINAKREAFHFAEVGAEFQLIEDGYAAPVAVPYGGAGRRLAALQEKGPSRETLRALQPYLVQIPRDQLNQLYRDGAVYEPAEGVYAVSPQNASMYDATFGLRLEDRQADPSQLIT